MSDSEDSDFSDNQSERSSDGEEVEENEVSCSFENANCANIYKQITVLTF